MRRARILAGVAAIGLLLAAPAPPAAADGLSRFEEALRDAPPGFLTFESGKPLGDNGFVLESVVIKPSDGAIAGVATDPLRMRRLAVEDFDFASFEKGEPPNYARLRAEGIEISGGALNGVNLRELIRRDRLIGDFLLDYRVDPERRTMTLNRLELDVEGLARIELSMVLDGIDPDDPGSTASASLRTASLVFDDRSLLGTALPNAAKAQGIDPDKIAQIVEMTLDGLRPGQGAATLAVLDALASYVADYKQPKGPLRLTLNPVRKTSLAALGEITDADEAMKVLGLEVSYAGARVAKEPRPENPAR